MRNVGELGEEIAAIAGRINVATHRLLTCIRGFDEAEGWNEQGAQSCAHWLTWRIGLDPGAAREKVRVARALGSLPAIDSAFAAGKLSYAKVRAITRIATAENEPRVLEVALAATGAQLERICRGFRTATESDSEKGTDRRIRARVLGSGLVKLELVVTADEADLFIQAIERAREELSGPAKQQAAASPETEPAPAAPRPTAADGLLHIASDFLASGCSRTEGVGAAQHQIVVHLDREATAETPAFAGTLDDGTHVSPETLRRVACDAGLVPALVDERAGVLDIGRRTRVIPPAIRRALWIRDRCCRFPGCANRRFVHGHHVRHWLHGGRTSLDNLVLLCAFHHRLVHEGGWAVSLTCAGEVDVRTPGGVRLPAAPHLAVDAGAVEWNGDWWNNTDAVPMALPAWDGEPPDYDAAVGSLMAA